MENESKAYIRLGSGQSGTAIDPQSIDWGCMGHKEQKKT